MAQDVLTNHLIASYTSAFMQLTPVGAPVECFALAITELLATIIVKQGGGSADENIATIQKALEESVRAQLAQQGKLH